MTTVLVEGLSDARAVEVLARNRGLDLTAYGVTVEVLGGITNLGARIVPDVRPPDPTLPGIRTSGDHPACCCSTTPARRGTSSVRWGEPG